MLRLATDNYRKVQQLLRDWESETERLINAEATPKTDAALSAENYRKMRSETCGM